MMNREMLTHQILPAAVQTYWNDPGQLYELIRQAVEGGLHSDVTAAAYRLYAIDPLRDRAAVALALVLMKAGDLLQAEHLLQREIAEHGPSGPVLTNLAKILSEQGEESKAEELLAKALELDPNQDFALLWFALREKQRSGEDGYVAVLERLGKAPGAWRPQILLARHKLQNGNVEDAVAVYHSLVEREPVPAEALFVLSGDLGKAGQVDRLVELVEPVYRPQIDLPYTGLNLLKAYVDSKQLEKAGALLGALRQLQVATLAGPLQEIERELAGGAQQAVN